LRGGTGPQKEGLFLREDGWVRHGSLGGIGNRVGRKGGGGVAGQGLMVLISAKIGIKGKEDV